MSESPHDGIAPASHVFWQLSTTRMLQIKEAFEGPEQRSEHALVPLGLKDLEKAIACAH